MYLNLEISPSCLSKNLTPHTTMFCTICSQHARYYCPCRLVKYCSKSCQTAHWKQHKSEHKHVMRTLEEAMAPRRESTEDLMRGPFERELRIIAGGISALDPLGASTGIEPTTPRQGSLTPCAIGTGAVIGHRPPVAPTRPGLLGVPFLRQTCLWLPTSAICVQERESLGTKMSARRTEFWFWREVHGVSEGWCGHEQGSVRDPADRRHGRGVCGVPGRAG